MTIEYGLLSEIPFIGRTRLGILFQPVCNADTKYPIVILEFDPILRDYILLSQITPLQLPSFPPSPATWSVTNLQDRASLNPVDLLITIPDSSMDLECQTTQKGGDLFLGVEFPEEFDLSLSLSGVVIGSIYVDFPNLLPPPPIFLPPPPLYENIPVDGSFPPDFEYPPGFLWPSQVNKFYPWYFIMYGDTPLPPLEMLPSISVYEV